MIWIRNGIRATRSMVKDGLTIPPVAATRERSLQELTLKMIEGRILPCQLDPRQRRMTHRKTILCGREGIAVSIGSKLPHQVIQWRPKLRSETEMSSVAGDTSDVSAAAHGLKSIREYDGDAVKGSRGDAEHWW